MSHTTDKLAHLRHLQAQCEADFRANALKYPELLTEVAQRRLKAYMSQQTSTKGGLMPSKGYRTMGEELENVAMRLPMSVLAQVDAHIETLRQEAPWAKVGRSDALRDLVVRGLASLSRRPARQAIATQPQPALPLVPASTPEVRSVPNGPPNAVVQEKTSQPQEKRKGGRPGTKRQPILALLREHPEGLTAEQIRAYLDSPQLIGDTLAGMRRSGVVKVEGEGNRRRYYAMDEQLS